MFRTTNEKTTVTECSWTNWTDEELLLEYRCTGIRETFEELVHRYERELYNYLYHYLGNATHAEDVFQKTFLAVLEGCDTFKACREFRPWLYRIARNTAVNLLREAKHFSVVSIDAPMGNDSEDYCIANTIVGNEPEPFEDPMDKEIAGKVRKAVDSLPEQMRQAVYMVYFQGLSYREAADAVGVHFGTLSDRMKLAIKKLNFLLKNVG
jgi:RNA polymerase sigma-70 factor (ECF subfamily)